VDDTYPKEKKTPMKGLVTVCSECGAKTELRAITIEFERKGIRATMSGVPAMVCPACGEEYVPGNIAGDIIDTVAQTIDGTEKLLKRAKRHRRKLVAHDHSLPSERLELALAT
jgi:YgiT-type zinc finger domain-containing protein